MFVCQIFEGAITHLQRTTVQMCVEILESLESYGKILLTGIDLSVHGNVCVVLHRKYINRTPANFYLLQRIYL